MTLILKGTNGCNLNCAYCSLGEKPNCDVIDSDMLKHIFEYVCILCEQRNDHRVNIILHGGEPTLVPVAVYDMAISHIKNRFSNLTIGISMQTNAYRISEEYLSFMKQHNVNVGVSIDGSEAIHDHERRSKNGHKTFGDVMQNIDRMQSVGLNVSGLMVLTSIGVTAPHDYLNLFAARHIHLKINPLLNYGEAHKNPGLSLQQGDYADYLIRLYEYVIANKINITVSPIDKILHAIVRNEPIRECTFRDGCNKDFLCIDQNGDIYPCGRFSDIKQFRLGNVCNQTEEPLEISTLQPLLLRRSCRVPAKCQKCEYLDLCHAGCSAEAVIEGELDMPPVLCKDYRMLFDYFHGKGLRLLREQLVQRKHYLLEVLDGI